VGHRQRFTKEEKAAFTVGAHIEWQNGGHWHPGEDRQLGTWHVGIRHTGRRTATLHPGQYITGSPGKVRPVQVTEPATAVS
jgi:hypothetical protein